MFGVRSAANEQRIVPPAAGVVGVAAAVGWTRTHTLDFVLFSASQLPQLSASEAVHMTAVQALRANEALPLTAEISRARVYGMVTFSNRNAQHCNCIGMFIC